MASPGCGRAGRRTAACGGSASSPGSPGGVRRDDGHHAGGRPSAPTVRGPAVHLRRRPLRPGRRDVRRRQGLRRPPAVHGRVHLRGGRRVDDDHHDDAGREHDDRRGGDHDQHHPRGRRLPRDLGAVRGRDPRAGRRRDRLSEQSAGIGRPLPGLDDLRGPRRRRPARLLDLVTADPLLDVPFAAVAENYVMECGGIVDTQSILDLTAEHRDHGGEDDCAQGAYE
jgi:hypothetical protein